MCLCLWSTPTYQLTAVSAHRKVDDAKNFERLRSVTAVINLSKQNKRERRLPLVVHSFGNLNAKKGRKENFA